MRKRREQCETPAAPNLAFRIASKGELGCEEFNSDFLVLVLLTRFEVVLLCRAPSKPTSTTFSNGERKKQASLTSPHFTASSTSPSLDFLKFDHHQVHCMPKMVTILKLANKIVFLHVSLARSLTT